MTCRGYRTMDSVWKKICALDPDWNGSILLLNEIYPTKMNKIYMNICWHNLCEKYLCGGISEEDWIKIDREV